MYKTKLKIADVAIGFKSRFPIGKTENALSFRYKNFIYRGNKKPEVVINVKLVKKLPRMKKGTKKIFSTQHPQSDGINWALFKNNGHFILKDYIASKQQNYFLNQEFNKATAYLLRAKRDRLNWQLDEIIYDALQIILIHYLSRRNGFFVHSLGIKDRRGRGLLFAGKSGQGKSTLARIWHKHSRDQILNDDRIIVRKIRNDFFIYGTPWHGDFADYLVTKTEKARLDKLFFIFHSKNNNCSEVNNKIDEFIYPCLFFPFWDRRGIEKVIGLCRRLTNNVACFRLGFKNTKRVIGFVKNSYLSTN
jgi:hypothetical protein